MEPEPSPEREDETMTLRLCLRIGLLSPWIVLTCANGNGAAQCRSSTVQCLIQPTCSLYLRPLVIHNTSHAYPLTRQASHFSTKKLLLQHRSNDNFLEEDSETWDTGPHKPAAPCSVIPDRPHSQTDMSVAINNLKHAFENRSFFQLGDKEVLGLLHSAYHTEISYLSSAYFAGCPPATGPRTSSPSEVLYGTKYPEVDRTLTGLLALRWIEKNAYHYFIQNQSSSTRLRYESFKELREYFHAHTRGFMNHDIVFTLVTMQVTNDLGKSAQLKIDLEGHLPRGVPVSSNHDMMMFQILELDQGAKLIPSFCHLRPDLRNTAYKSIHLSAGFNPGQLVQGECAPAALTILTKLDLGERDLHLKFMELFLDVAGARGHVNHEGSLTMTEACYQGYCLARDVSLKVARGSMSPWEAYKAVLRSKIKSLQQSGWRVPKGFDLARDATAIAKTRIFCMARVIDAETADLINRVYDNLPIRTREALEEGLCRYGTVDRPAVQPTYMPAMFANLKSHTDPAHAFSALLTYLAHVLTLTQNDLAQLEPGAVVVERDVREILENCMGSDVFQRDPHAVVNASTPLPALQVLQKAH